MKFVAMVWQELLSTCSIEVREKINLVLFMASQDQAVLLYVEEEDVGRLSARARDAISLGPRQNIKFVLGVTRT